MLGAGMVLPQGGTAFVSVKDADKDNILPAVEKLVELGFAIIATAGTAVLHIFENGERIGNNLVRLVAFNISHKADAAGVVLKRGIV